MVAKQTTQANTRLIKTDEGHLALSPSRRCQSLHACKPPKTDSQTLEFGSNTWKKAARLHLNLLEHRTKAHLKHASACCMLRFGG
jgi:hypothetical protein